MRKCEQVLERNVLAERHEVDFVVASDDPAAGVHDECRVVLVPGIFLD